MLARTERARVANIQEDYLKRSFAAILLRHQDSLFDLRDAGDIRPRQGPAENVASGAN